MQRMTWQQKASLKFGRPTRLDEFEIKFFVGTVNLVADNRMA